MDDSSKSQEGGRVFCFARYAAFLADSIFVHMSENILIFISKLYQSYQEMVFLQLLEDCTKQDH